MKLFSKLLNIINSVYINKNYNVLLENKEIIESKFVYNDKKNILNWLKKHDIKYKKDKYFFEKENNQFIINSRDDVVLYKRIYSIKKIPVKFGTILGEFYCDNLGLETLENCPHTVQGDFSCSDNNLISLKHGPKFVKKSYVCYNNKLITLKGACENTIDYFNCSKNKLITLEGCPKNILSTLFAQDNPSLESFNIPYASIYGNIYISNSPKISLKGMPKLAGILNFEENTIRSLAQLNECNFEYGFTHRVKNENEKIKELEFLYHIKDDKWELKFFDKNLYNKTVKTAKSKFLLEQKLDVKPIFKQRVKI